MFPKIPDRVTPTVKPDGGPMDAVDILGHTGINRQALLVHRP